MPVNTQQELWLYTVVVNFQTWLSGEMEARRWTQESLGRLIGVSQVTVGQWLRGKDRPRPDPLRELARVAEVDAIWLFQLVGYLPKSEAGEGDEARVNPKVTAILRELESLPDEVLDLLFDQIRHVLRPRAALFIERGENADEATEKARKTKAGGRTDK